MEEEKKEKRGGGRAQEGKVLYRKELSKVEHSYGVRGWTVLF